MRVPSAIFWGFVVLLLLVVLGIIIYASVALSRLEPRDARNSLFVPTVLLLTVGVLALAGWIALFVLYTVQTRNSGNWYDSIKDKGKAAQQRAREFVNEKRSEWQAAQEAARDARLRAEAQRRGGVFLSQSEADRMALDVSRANRAANDALQQLQAAEQRVAQ